MIYKSIRDAAIINGYKLGVKQIEMSKTYEISRQRVHAIIKKHKENQKNDKFSTKGI